MPKLRIAEIFASVQGEGIFAGVPSTFVRVSGCNLRCVWCDTPYASWSPEGEVREVSEVAAQVAGHGLRHAVLTGGEPMLFEAVAPLAQALREAGHFITVETAGTVWQPVACDLMSISPKLAHSAPPESTPGAWHERHEAVRLNMSVLTRLIQAYDTQIKFVIAETDLSGQVQEIDALLADLPSVMPERILLMAEGRVTDALRRQARILVPLCLSRGWRLTPRLQIDLFGDTRGT